MTGGKRRRRLVAAGVAIAALAGLVTVVAAQEAPGDVKITEEEIDLSPLERAPPDAWRRLASRRIWFARRSVGEDIVAGIEEIGRRRPQARVATRLVEGPADLGGEPGLGHTPIGENGDARSKIDDFAKRLRAAGPGKTDIALLKLCYVDVTARSGAEGVFRAYSETLAALEGEFPGTVFVRTTVPLTAPRTELKTRVKRALGMLPQDEADNRVRQQYNALVREEARRLGKPLLDVAAAESALADGSRATFRLDGDEIPCLARCFTTDGGHLNGPGRLAVARETLLALEEAAR